MLAPNEESITSFTVCFVDHCDSLFCCLLYCCANFSVSFWFRCLEGVLKLHKEIKEDEYLVPYAIVEIAWLYIDEGRIENAIAALEDAKWVSSLPFLTQLTNSFALLIWLFSFFSFF